VDKNNRHRYHPVQFYREGIAYPGVPPESGQQCPRYPKLALGGSLEEIRSSLRTASGVILIIINATLQAKPHSNPIAQWLPDWNVNPAGAGAQRRRRGVAVKSRNCCGI